MGHGEPQGRHPSPMSRALGHISPARLPERRDSERLPTEEFFGRPSRRDINLIQQNRLNQGEPEDHADDNPALSKVVERNIRTLIQLRLQAAHARSVQDLLADAITTFSGRMGFVYVHIVWFGVWILLNTGRVGVRPFDPFPYGLLTMVVSLEAIFLATFVLIIAMCT